MHMLQTMLRRLSRAPATPKTLFPPGHFYSPVVDVDELRQEQARVWPAKPEVLGIDFNDAYRQHVLHEYFPTFYPDFAYPQHSDGNPLNFRRERSIQLARLPRTVRTSPRVATKAIYRSGVRLLDTACRRC